MNELQLMQNVLDLEAKSLQISAKRLTNEVALELIRVYQFLLDNEGSLIFCGVGKSGIVAQKLASTFSSLGLNSFFLHPIEALHGDLGRLRKNDVIVYISKSGSTEEIVKLLPFVSLPASQQIGILGHLKNTIADHCKIVLDATVEKEACLNNQAPTTSSTVAMGMGDAMAVLWESFVGLSKEKFAINHPGGILGKSLRMKVRDLLVPINECPLLKAGDTLQDVILSMTKLPVGGAAVLDQKKKLLGIFVEGDIRRTFAKNQDALKSKVEDIMNKKPITVSVEMLAFEALDIMENKTRQISVAPVLDGEIFVGFLRLHDLIKAGFNRQDQ